MRSYLIHLIGAQAQRSLDRGRTALVWDAALVLVLLTGAGLMLLAAGLGLALLIGPILAAALLGLGLIAGAALTMLWRQRPASAAAPVAPPPPEAKLDDVLAQLVFSAGFVLARAVARELAKAGKP